MPEWQAASSYSAFFLLSKKSQEKPYYSCLLFSLSRFIDPVALDCWDLFGVCDARPLPLSQIDPPKVNKKERERRFLFVLYFTFLLFYFFFWRVIFTLFTSPQHPIKACQCEPTEYEAKRIYVPTRIKSITLGREKKTRKNFKWNFDLNWLFFYSLHVLCRCTLGQLQARMDRDRFPSVL